MAEGSNDTPGQQSVIREAARSPFDKLIKSWLDYKAFSKQRRQLLADPKLALTGSGEADRTWKSPFSFATQGLVITTVIIQLIASAFGLMFVRPEPYLKRIRTAIQENIQTLKENEQTLKNNLAIVNEANDNTLFEVAFDILKKPIPGTSFGISKPEYVKALTEAIQRTDKTLAQSQSDEIKRQLDSAERIESVSSTIAKVLVPFALVLAAYVFGFLFKRRTRTSNPVALDRPHEVYLYITTACLFWMNAALTVAHALFHSVLVYSGFYDRMMFGSASFGGGLVETQLLFIEAEIVVPFLLCLPVILFAFRRTAAAIRTVYDLPQPKIMQNWIGSYIRVANTVSFIALMVILNLFSWGYVNVGTMLEGKRINLDPTSKAVR
jgi:hypothetical protein